MERQQRQQRQLARVTILYGSQTGTAQDAAEFLARALQMRHVDTISVLPMDKYPIDQLPDETYCLFVCSTTGQGEAPDNMKRFWKCLLNKSLPANLLEAMAFSVFGLGDSSYPKFNFAAKRLNRRLETLGAQRVVPIGLADDQHALGVEGALLPWIESVVEHTLSEYFPGLQHRAPITFLPPRYALQSVPADSVGEEGEAPLPRIVSSEHPCKETPAQIPLVKNTRLTPSDHFQDVRHVVFDATNANIHYGAGDVLYIMPENTDEQIDEIIDWFEGINVPEPAASHGRVSSSPGDDVYVALECAEDAKSCLPTEHFPQCLSWRQLLKYHLDIHAVPRRRFFEIMAHFADDEQQKEKLAEFLTGEGQEALFDYCHRMRRTGVEIIKDFTSTCKRIPFQYAADMFGFMQPRAFSISSAPAVHSNDIHATIAIVNYTTQMKTPRTGLFTSFLNELQPGSMVHAWTQESTLPLPPHDKCAICIGPGTGVAPFRSIIHQRVAEGATDNILVFGNRNAKADFFYSEEWQELAAKGALTYFTAFSRDQEDKIYVQHVIEREGLLLAAKIAEGAHILVAGSSNNMPDQVRDAIKAVLLRHVEGIEDEAMAEKYVNIMEKKRRYVCETWS